MVAMIPTLPPLLLLSCASSVPPQGPNTGGEQVFLGDQWHSVDPERVVSFW